MNISKLAEVGARLEKAVAENSTDSMSAMERYELYETVAIAMLDSEFEEYADGALEVYLMEYLSRKQIELGVEFGQGGR